MELNAETFEAISGQAVRAAEPKIVKVPGVDDSAYLVHGDQLTGVALPPARRTHNVNRLQDFIAAVGRWGEQGVVWHSDEQITLVVDDGERRDFVTMRLEYSEHFLTVRDKLTSPRRHRDFVGLLRRDLCEVVPATLLPLVRKIEATSASGAVSEVAVGRERGTREYQADIIGAGELPEHVDARFQVYANLELDPVTVRLLFDVTLPPQELAFTLSPMPSELDRALRCAQLQLNQLLINDLVEGTVFYGDP